MAQYAAVLDLATLNGANGFRIDGVAAGDWLGYRVGTGGDVNGDGFDDLIVSAYHADPGGDADAGETYVVFGKASGWGATFDLTTLDGIIGFRLDGIDADDRSGAGVSVGDINGDGYDDIIIGGSRADGGGDANAGETYVVFGKASGFSAAFDLSTLDGTNGFRLDGIDAGDWAGWAVSSGDVNNDGFDDLIIGAVFAAPGGDAEAGETYVVFGKASGFSAAIDLTTLDGATGFRLDGIDPSDHSGLFVASAGDVNGDGYDDIMIGAPLADAFAGEVYVVFGKVSGFSAAIDLSTLDGTNGFRLDGIDAGDRAGYSVASAGDVNGDGFDDIIIGAYRADPGGDLSAGESYIVFGKGSGWSAAIDLSALDGTNGFRVDGIDAGDGSGHGVSSAGDFNGDGFADLIIGAYHGDPGGDAAAGETYVIFGKASGWSAAVDPSTLDGDTGFRLEGVNAGEYSGYSVASAGDLNGDGFDDIVIGGFRADPGGNIDAGVTYIVFGGKPGEAVTRTGTAIDNKILGGDLNDTLVGLAGDDTLFGNDGNDTLEGGAGADSINGGAGFDIASYGQSNSAIRVALWNPSLNTGDAAGDVIQFTTEAIFGTRYADNIQGNSSANNLRGGDGNDLILGGFGNDTLVGGAGADDMGGGSGFDMASYAGGGAVRVAMWNPALNSGDAAGDNIRPDVEVVEGSFFNDTLEGNASANNLRGSFGHDRLSGGGGNDTLSGDFGNDTLDGGAGNDSLIGGGANDTFIYASGGGADVIADFLSGSSVIDVIQLNGFGAAFDTFNEVINAATQNGADTVINFGAGQTLTLQNIIIADLDPDDFAFG